MRKINPSPTSYSVATQISDILWQFMTMVHSGFNLILSIVPLVKTLETRKITDRNENIYKERTLPLIAMQNVVS